jgi:adenine/guanine/hypoxanthine permease
LGPSRPLLVADALATSLGACLGTSTVTSYIESAAGLAQGGRTGLTALVVSVLFLLALFFGPVVAAGGALAALFRLRPRPAGLSKESVFWG